MKGAIILGTTGFLLYFIYDLNSVLWKNTLLQKLFAAGSICVVMSAAWSLWDGLKNGPAALGVFAVCAAGGLIFLILLVYTLFFALPFEETYVKESSMRLAHTEGVYALCRHSGVLWFAGLFFCLWGMTGEFIRGIYFAGMILWNYLYIVFQDLWTFPRTFSNYREYKKTAPFIDIDIEFLPAVKDAVNMSFSERNKAGFKLALKKDLGFFFGLGSVAYAVSMSLSSMTSSGKGMHPGDILKCKPHMVLRMLNAKYKCRQEHRELLPKDLFHLKGFMVAGTDNQCYKDDLERLWEGAPWNCLRERSRPLSVQRHGREMVCTFSRIPASMNLSPWQTC